MARSTSASEPAPATQPPERSEVSTSAVVAHPAPPPHASASSSASAPAPAPRSEAVGKDAAPSQVVAPGTEQPVWHGFLLVQVLQPQKEGVSLPVSPVLSNDASTFATRSGDGDGEADHSAPFAEMVLPEEEEDEVFVSYLVRGRTNLPHFSQPSFECRRRFRDFDFLHTALIRDFPARVVPPLPDKHPLSHLAGDRYSPDFIHRRTTDLNIFLERVCRHPVLMRTPILCSFLSSAEWAVDMHAHRAAWHRASNISNTGDANESQSLLDKLSDKLVNVFSKVQEPDPHFVRLSSELASFRQALIALEGVESHHRSHASALSEEYEEFALSFSILAELETGMAPALHRLSNTLSEMGYLARLESIRSTDALIPSFQALVAYAQAFEGVLQTREAKQIELEELMHYLSVSVAERDRLASLAHGGGVGGSIRAPGITGYLRDQLDHFRGVDEERTRVERLQRLDARKAELRDAVTQAHDVLTSFTSQVDTESVLFDYNKQQEMHEVLAGLARGKVAFYQQSVRKWDLMLQGLGAAPV